MASVQRPEGHPARAVAGVVCESCPSRHRARAGPAAAGEPLPAPPGCCSAGPGRRSAGPGRERCWRSLSRSRVTREPAGAERAAERGAGAGAGEAEERGSAAPGR